MNVLQEEFVGLLRNELKEWSQLTAINAFHAAQQAKAPVPKNESFSDYCAAILRKDKKYLEEHYQSEYQFWKAKAGPLAESNATTGGYLVPTQFAGQILDIVAEKSIVRPRTRIVSMTADELLVPFPDVSSVQAAGVSPFYAGVQMYWTSEGALRKESEPRWKQLSLKANELSGQAVTSRSIFDDSGPTLSTWLMRLFGGAIAWFEEFAFFQGNGVGQPQGIIGAGATIAVTRANANQIGFADVAGMMSHLPPGFIEEACWVYNPSTLPQLLQLRDGSNRAMFMSSGVRTVDGKDYPQFCLGTLPAYASEKLPPLGTKGDLCLIVPSFYCVGHRSLFIDVSPHVNFLKNQITWRVVQRSDGQPWLDKPITLQDGVTKVSPFTVLN